MGETRGAGGDGREQWSATPPKPELKTSTPTSSRLAAPLRKLRRLFPLSVAVAAGVALFITLIPGEVGIIPSLPQDGQKTQRGAFGPADLGFPSLAHSAPRILAAAPIEERVEKAGVESGGGEDPDRSRGDRRRRESARKGGNRGASSHEGTSSEGEPEGEGQPVVAPPEEGVGAPPEPRPPPGQPPAEQASGQGNGNAGGNGNGQGNGNSSGNGNGNSGGNGNGNGQGNGNSGGNGGNGGDEGESGDDYESGEEEGGSEDEGGDEGEGDD